MLLVNQARNNELSIMLPSDHTTPIKSVTTRHGNLHELVSVYLAEATLLTKAGRASGLSSTLLSACENAGQADTNLRVYRRLWNINLDYFFGDTTVCPADNASHLV